MGVSLSVGSHLGSLREVCYDFGFKLGAPDFWKLPN